MTSRRTRTARVSTLEKAEQQHIVELFRSIGGRVYVMGTRRRRGDFPGTMQTEGIPDVMAFLPHRPSGHLWFVFVEVKRVGGKLRPEQQIFRELCAQSHVHHIVGTFDDVIAWAVTHGFVKADSFPHYRQPPATKEPAGDAQ